MRPMRITWLATGEGERKRSIGYFFDPSAAQAEIVSRALAGEICEIVELEEVEVQGMPRVWTFVGPGDPAADPTTSGVFLTYEEAAAALTDDGRFRIESFELTEFIGRAVCQAVDRVLRARDHLVQNVQPELAEEDYGDRPQALRPVQAGEQ